MATKSKKTTTKKEKPATKAAHRGPGGFTHYWNQVREIDRLRAEIKRLKAEKEEIAIGPASIKAAR